MNGLACVLESSEDKLPPSASSVPDLEGTTGKLLALTAGDNGALSTIPLVSSKAGLS